MSLVDSHCHLDRIDLTPYDNDLANAIAHAKQLGVDKFLCVCIDLESFNDVLAIAKRFPQVNTTVGIHPTTDRQFDPGIEALIAHAANDEVRAIGETGLDYFHCKGDLKWQQERFRRHIHAAIATKKPLIVHTRDAREDTIRIMREEGADQVGGVMHCFTETLEMAQAAMDLGFYISFSGIVTFKNAKEIQRVAETIPLSSILVETDCPYLAPMPYRGKPNVPAYVRYVAEKIAELQDESFEFVAGQTTKNFHRLFGSYDD